MGTCKRGLGRGCAGSGGGVQSTAESSDICSTGGGPEKEELGQQEEAEPLSDSGGRSACSHRTDQEGLQSKGQRVPRQARHGCCGGEREDGVQDERDSGCALLSL